jgi:hypothetical protein
MQDLSPIIAQSRFARRGASNKDPVEGDFTILCSTGDRQKLVPQSCRRPTPALRFDGQALTLQEVAANSGEHALSAGTVLSAGEATMWRLVGRHTGRVGYRRGAKAEGLFGMGRAAPHASHASGEEGGWPHQIARG